MMLKISRAGRSATLVRNSATAETPFGYESSYSETLGAK